ncbi:unnamed protein product [Caenorhabditis angaria]|uniref:Uncharacterized protein n=1 Tax=Caenorhabditis angaria TaxID=860376 RepID=A0A9P1I7D4_9PELO|nr:unnamed protein product [Caenorhabditis angaria]
MSEPKRIGRRVFPNRESSEIRKSQQFLHYSTKPILPPEEPPIDYTIKVKNDRDYKVVGDVFHRVPSTDFSREEDNLRSSRQKPKSSQKTVEEILDELDNVLFEASIPFDELKKKVENFNLSFKPYAPDSDLEEIQKHQRYTKEPIRIEPIRISRKDSNSNENLNLTALSSSSSKNSSKNNEKKIEEMFRKTQKEISEAKAYFSPVYFQAQFELDGVPAWKRNLLAEKKSKETIRRIEHDAWAKFERFKISLTEKRQQIRRSSSVQIGRSKK